jgi:hypothetical protein
VADVESIIVLNNGIKEPYCTELWDVSTAPNIAGWIWPTWKPMKIATYLLMTVNAMEIRRFQEKQNSRTKWIGM